MNIFKKIFNWFKFKKKDDLIQEDLSNILFDDNFKSDGRKPSYKDLEIDVFYVEDNLNGEKDRRYIKTLKYNEINSRKNEKGVYIAAHKFNECYGKSSSKEQEQEYIRQFSECSNLNKEVKDEK
jgi:hypothetical protein